MIAFRFVFFVMSFTLIGCASINDMGDNFKDLVYGNPKESYIVQPGDSVWSIGIKLEIDPQLIILRNNLKKPYVIYPNQRLEFSFTKRLPVEIVETRIKWHPPLTSNAQAEKQGRYWLKYLQPKGQSIHSISEGKVVVSGPDIPGYGNLVMISHPSGYLSLYAHCDKIFVKQGDQVSRGMIIANVGNSESSSSMLRFQVRKNGKPLNNSLLEFHL